MSQKISELEALQNILLNFTGACHANPVYEKIVFAGVGIMALPWTFQQGGVMVVNSMPTWNHIFPSCQQLCC